MEQPKLVSRIYAALQAQAGHERVTMGVGDFTLFLSTRSPGGSFAMANSRHPAAGPADISSLRAAFAAQGRQAAVHALDSFATELPAALLESGLVLASEQTVMACTPTTLRRPGAAELDLMLIDARSSNKQLIEALTVNAQGFDPSAPRVTPEEADALRRRLRNKHLMMGSIDGQGVCSGMATGPFAGVVQLVGIATLAPYRRRGFGAAITAALAGAAFEQGAEAAYLIAAAPEAQRVYERAGFQRCGTLLVYQERPGSA